MITFDRQKLDQAILDAGLNPPKEYTAGRSRLDRSDKRPGNKAGSLWLKGNYEVASITNFATGETVVWNVTSTTETTPEQRRQWAKERAEQRKREATRKARNGRRAAKRARALTTGARNSRNHGYGLEKGLTFDYLVNNNQIVVPAYRDGQLVTAQTISPDGTKRFITGGSTAGITHQIGTDSNTLVVAEGWATGMRIRQITGLTVVVVFSAGNVAKYIKPDHCKQLLIATDNDKSRAGENAADKLQQRYPDAVSVLPPTIGTDWADYTPEEIRGYWKETTVESVHGYQTETSVERIKGYWSDYLPEQIDIDSQYLQPYMLEWSNHLVIKSEHGTGKSYATREWIRQQVQNELSVLIVCNGKAQVADTLARLNDGSGARFDDYSFGADTVACSSRLVICVDSILKVEHRFDVIVFDESEQLTGAPLKKNLHAAQGDSSGRVKLAHHMCYLASKAKRTLWMDADAGSLTQTIIKHSEIEATTITNRYKVLNQATFEFVGVNALEQRIRNDQGQWHLFCSSLKDSMVMHKKHGGVLVNRNTKNSIKQALISSFASCEKFTDNLITTTTVQSSVSIDVGNHNIKTVYARVKVGPGLPSLDAVMQSLRRARGVEHFVICVETAAQENPLPVDPDRIVYEDITEPNLHNRRFIKQQELLLPSQNPIDGFAVDGVLKDLYGHRGAQQNHERNDPKTYLMERFKQSGATVIDAVSDNDTGKETRTAEKAIREQIKADELHQIATADIPTIFEHKTGIRETVPRILARAKHETNATTEQEIREVARREYLKAEKYISGAKRLKRDLQSAEKHAADDIERGRSGDPLNRPKSLLVAMKKQLIQLVHDAGFLDGREFSAQDLEPIIRPWLLQNGCLFAKMSGRRVGDPSKIRAAQNVVTLLESWGIWVERIDGKQKRYSINPQEATARMLVTYCNSIVLRTKSPAAVAA